MHLWLDSRDLNDREDRVGFFLTRTGRISLGQQTTGGLVAFRPPLGSGSSTFASPRSFLRVRPQYNTTCDPLSLTLSQPEPTMIRFAIALVLAAGIHLW